MSNDKHPDHHFDDDLISQLYDASKEGMQPSSDMDDRILAQLNGSSEGGVAAVLNNSDGNVTDLSSARDDAKSAPRTPSKKKWFVPNSLVACLMVSVMVGLIYRENADKLLISDPTELDYAIPMPSVERSVTTKSKVSVSGEELSVESDEVSDDFEETDVQESPMVMDSTSSFSEMRPEVQGASAENVEALVIKKQEVAEQEPSTQQTSGAVAPSVPVESKKVAVRKSKKSKPKPLMQKAEPSRMLMMAPPIHAEERASDTMDFKVEFNMIRKLRDDGDVVGALALLDTLIAKYPSIELPVDIVLLKGGSK